MGVAVTAVLAVAAFGLAARAQQGTASNSTPMKMNMSTNMTMPMPMAKPATAGPATPEALLAATPENAKAAVSIDNFVFSPATLTVAVGTTVTWTNRDDVPHTVTSDEKQNKPFASKALDTDETFSFQFTKPGTYAYFCAVHSQMVGKVIVH
jgi:plastocyanin